MLFKKLSCTRTLAIDPSRFHLHLRASIGASLGFSNRVLHVSEGLAGSESYNLRRIRLYVLSTLESSDVNDCLKGGLRNAQGS